MTTTRRQNDGPCRSALGSVSVAVTPQLTTITVVTVNGYKAVARSDGTGSVEKIEKPPAPPPPPEQPKQRPAKDAPDQWREAGSFLAALLQPGNAMKFAAALWSKLTEGPATDQAINFRASCCFGLTLDGERITDQCPALHQHDKGYFCRACGCPDWKLADLMPQNKQPIGRGAHGEPIWDWTTSKLAYPALSCPLRKFSPVRGRRKENGSSP